MSIYDNAGVVLIPSGYKAGTTDNLYSVLPANGDGDFNATRGSSATRVNKDGFIESVANNVPRLDYPLIDGVVQDCPHLLLEPSRANVLPYSEEMDNAGWSKSNSTITANQIVSPDGSQTADKYTHGGSTAANYIFESGFSISSGTEYTFSVFVKKGTTDFVQLLLSSAMFGTLHQNFDINNGVIGSRSGDATAFIEEYPNDWFRIGITDTATSTGTGSALISLARSNTENRIASFSSSQYFYLWGAQFETGSYATSYIPTSGGQETRSADACNGSGTSADINSEEGVLFVEIAALSDENPDHRRITLSNSTSSNVVRISYDTVSQRIIGVLFNGANQCVFQATKSNSTITDVLHFNKVALSYKENQFKFFINGTQFSSTDTSGTTFSAGTLTELAFDNGGGGNLFLGKCKQVMNFKTTLTDSELETLTSWDSFNAMAKGQLYTIE